MRCPVAVLLALLGSCGCAWAQSQTAFVYQGDLQDGGAPANGVYDLRFVLFDTPFSGTQLGATVCVDNVQVSDGRFAATIDFGQQYAGDAARYLDIAVRPDTGLDCAGAAGFTSLSPRQRLLAVPYAAHALAAHALDAPDGAPTNAVFVDNAGNVGIGTTAPSAKLVVQAPADQLTVQGIGAGVDNAAYIYFSNAAGTPLGYVGDGSSGDDAIYLTSYNDSVHIYTAAGAALTATPAGDVGIGTASPVSKLHVQGDTYISGQLTVGSAAINISPVLRSYTMHAYEFRVRDPDTFNGYRAYLDDGLHDRSRLNPPNYAEYVACPHLPHNAEIIALELVGYDGAPGDWNIRCALGRTHIQGGTLEMAVVESLTGGNVWQTSTVFYPYVDNVTHSYWVRVTMAGWGDPETEHVLRAVRIIYRISQPLP